MLVDETTYKNFRIKIYTDEYPINPIEWDNIGTMICFHKKYNLGNKHNYNDFKDFLESLSKLNDTQIKILFNKSKNIEDYFEKLLEIIKNANVLLPLYLYDHSGITMSTVPFSCKWDSSFVGYIYVPYSKIKTEFNYKNITINEIQKIKNILISEVKIYDSYLRGDVYTYKICNKNNKIIYIENNDFYGWDIEANGLMNDARSYIDTYLKIKYNEHYKKLKNWIKHKVIFDKRYPLKLN